MTLPRNGQLILAVLIVVGVFALAILVLGGVIHPASEPIMLLVAGVIFGNLTFAFATVTSYYFGSSVGALTGQPSGMPAKDVPAAPGPAPVAAPPVAIPPPVIVPPIIVPPLTPAAPPAPIPATPSSITQTGKMSTFGGPDDTGVAPDEGLALCEQSEVGKFPGLFLAQPPGTTGTARRLDPTSAYVAMRWSEIDHRLTRSYLQGAQVAVQANGRQAMAQPIDWGPAASTGRICDLSPGLADALGLKTDDTCTVVIPLPGAGTAPPAGNVVPTVGEPPWLTLARGEIGFHELPDNHGIQKYVDLAGYGADGEPWCSIFAGAMLREAHVDTTGATAMARSWETAPCVTKVPTPQPGDLAVFWRGSLASGQGHVGFYVSDAGNGRINVLGGNENDQVEIEPIPTSGSASGLTGYYRPRLPSEPKLS